jgi:hypothetical protein
MAIYVTGDIHRSLLKLNHIKYLAGLTLTKDDILIIAGDFGLLWYGELIDSKLLTELNNKPWTTLFIDGNHENFDLLDKLPTVEKYGNDVGYVRDSIYHLRRGRVYDILGTSIFTFGGGLSIDKDTRTEGVDWWSREYASTEELDLAWKSIHKHHKVDYVISHTPPSNILEYMVTNKFLDLTGEHLRDISQVLLYDHWYFGHMHVDAEITEKFTCVYNKFIKLEV